MSDSPFGQYAPLVAVAVAIGVLAAWVATLLSFVPSNATLDSVALVIIGAIFGGTAAARYVANGAERKADIANTRLDAVHAPSATNAERINAVIANESTGGSNGGDDSFNG